MRIRVWRAGYNGGVRGMVVSPAFCRAKKVNAMMYLWIEYVIIAVLVYQSCNDLAFSLIVALYLILVLWPLALPVMFVCEFFKAISRK